MKITERRGTVTDGRVVEKVVELSAAVERVWRAITDPAELSRWFGHETEIELSPGGDAAFIWREHGRYAARVVEVDPPHRLVWSWVHVPGVAFEDAPHTTVEWRLTPRAGGGTTLYLAETGFLTDLHHSQNSGGWDEELAELVGMLKA
jgi:uncharacterized protein YndB with AHSA1/START domain